MTDPIRTRVEVPHNDAPELHKWVYLRPRIHHNQFSEGPWHRFRCMVESCPGRLLVREADIEQMVNDATKETT